MAEIQIPQEAQRLIESINRKIDDMDLSPDQYKDIKTSYMTHILGDASIKNPKKKLDLQSFYRDLSEIFKFEKEEIDFLIGDSQGGLDGSTALGVTTRILEKDKEAKLFLNDLVKTEYALNYSQFKK